MSDTISEFTNFISNDPLMLALCIAIVVLIIVFILVLILGKKKDDDEELTENTTTLLQSDINDANLKSTQEFEAVNEAVETVLSSTKKIPVVNPPVEDETDKEAPINIDAALKLKEEREKENPTEVVPTIPTPDVPASIADPAVPATEPLATGEMVAPETPATEPFGVNNEPAPEVPAAPVEPITEVPAAAPIEVPAEPLATPEEITPAPVEATDTVSPASIVNDGTLPGIPDSTVNNSDDTSGMFGNLVESLSEENKEQVIETPGPDTLAPATTAPAEASNEPSEVPTVFGAETPAPETAVPEAIPQSESGTSVPLAGAPIAKEEKKVSFAPGQKTPEIITGTESSFKEKEATKEEPAPVATEAPGPAVLTPEEEEIELPMFSAPASDDNLNNLSGESFKI